MITDRAGNYIASMHLSSGKDLAFVSERWNRTYPDTPFTVAEAEAFLAELQRLRDRGDKIGGTVTAAAENMRKPVLTVIEGTPPAVKKKATRKKTTAKAAKGKPND